MRNIQFKNENEKKLRQQYPDSLFLEEGFDNAIIGFSVEGSVIYHHYELLYTILDINKDEFEGGDYELEKEEFTDEFIEFYDRFDEQLQMEFSHYRTLYENGISDLIPPVLITLDPDNTAAE